MYLNGLEVGSTSISNIINSDTDYPLEIGHEFFTSYVSKYYFDGEIAEILFFDQTLTEDRSQIFAYLAEKWNLTTSVDSDGDGFTDAVEKGKGTSPTDSTSVPSDIPSVLLEAQLWLDAENIDGEGNVSLSDGDAVVEWKDLSGNHLDLQQSTGSYMPTYSVNSIIFDGSDDRLENTTLDYGLISEDASIFVALKPTSNRGLIIDQSFGHGGNERGWNLHRGDDDWASIPSDSVVWNSHNYVGNQNYGMYAYSKENTSPINQKQIISLVKDGNQLAFDVNGHPVEMQDDTLYASTITYNSGYILNVGRKVFGPDYLGFLPYKGDIHEIIVINRKISDEEKTDIQRYLALKWDLEAITDSDGDGIVDEYDTDPTDSNK
jgi:hypothetical protein